MTALLHSRKFWISLLDMIVSILTYFIGKYLNPEAGKDILFLIASLQPILAMLIYTIAKEDSAKIAIGVDPGIGKCISDLKQKE